MNDEEMEFSTETGAAPTVVVETHGDLRLTGWDRSTVLAETEDEELLTVEERDGAVYVVMREDGELHVPRAALVQVSTACGDVLISALSGQLTIGELAGDLALRDVGATQIDVVFGDLSARNIHGDLRANRIAADASVRSVDGDFAAEAIGADLVLRGVAGSVSAVTGADASLSLDPVPGRDYNVTAGSSITCRLPEAANAQLEVTTGADALVVKLPVENLPLEAEADGVYRLTLGAGGPKVLLQAGGGVVLAAGSADHEVVVDMGIQFAEEFSGMAEHIAHAVEGTTERMLAGLSERLAALSETLPGVLEAAGLSGTDADRTAERVRLSGQRAAERAAERARRHAQAAASRAERKVAKAQRRAEREAHRIKTHVLVRGPHGLHAQRPVPPRPGHAAAPIIQPVTDEERMAILRMLEGGKITAEQAESLLKSLAGHGK